MPAAAAQPAQGSSEPVAPRIYLFIWTNLVRHVTSNINSKSGLAIFWLLSVNVQHINITFTTVHVTYCDMLSL
jgi:hypothetical protein